MASTSTETEHARTGTASLATIVALVLLALMVRSLRLDWQPLWWDEGYSVYFATEPLARMTALTAADIHPPLYYALLHGWLWLLDAQGPLALRTFSVLVGVLAIPAMAWLSVVLFPGRTRVALLATLLLALSPIHLYYSQEVRMYGLALLLGMVATALFWRYLKHPTLGRAAAYVLAATLGLYTLYYLGFLLLGHALWGIWSQRRARRGRRWHARQLGVVGLYAALLLLYLPWIAYATPQLVGYVDAKIASDQDASLGILTYIARHLTAFTGGHLPNSQLTQRPDAWLGVAALALLAIAALAVRRQSRRDGRSRTPIADTPAVDEVAPAPYGALWTFLLTPVLCAFLLNLRLPFFPEGGERVLLYVLPYVLLLAAGTMDDLWQVYAVGPIAAAALFTSATAGLIIFHTTPRYVERDYRPIIAQVVQQGQDSDTFLAIFPWQLGYWRAYAPMGPDAPAGPQPLLLADRAVSWDEGVATQIDAALARGSVWFPAPLSFGSTLPAAVEAYLAAHALNIENRWHGAATRLSAWRTAVPPPIVDQAIDYGPARLVGAGVAPENDAKAVASNNAVVPVALDWQPTEAETDLTVTLRLRDDAGRTWAQRDYAPMGSLSAPAGSDADGRAHDRLGFIVPAGLPPDRYSLDVGVGISGTETLLYPDMDAASPALAEADPLATVGQITVTPPDTPPLPARLPIGQALEPPEVRSGLAFLGSSGLGDGQAHLAGSNLALTLFLQNRSAEPPAVELYVSLLADGQGVAGWTGWPLPTYPSETWALGALAQAPVSFYLPATLSPGDYALIAGTVDLATGEQSAPVALGDVSVKQRAISFARPTITHPLDPPIQFGTHARLIGYNLDAQADAIHLVLHWQVLQTLLPAHHLFVHLDDGEGRTIAQIDGVPVTAAGRAPSGSWLPDEFISTVHTIPLPASSPQDVETLHFTVGIYNPVGNIRLPASVDGEPKGDSAMILLAR